MNRTALGKQIREARKNRQLTVEQLAELADVTPKYLRQLETGNSAPSLTVFLSICNALRVSSDFLLLGNLETRE